MPQLTQSYYPRCTLRLIIRIDEYGAEKPLQARAPTATTKNLNGLVVPRSPLKAQLDPTAPPGVTRYIIAEPGNVTTGGPQGQTQSSDKLTWDVTVIPKEVSWVQNGVKEAATMHATIKYIDAPLDPRLMRAVGIEMYLGCITEDQFAAQNEGTFSGQSVVLPTGFVGPLGETRTNLRFQGWVNKWEVTWNDSEPVIEIECQDNSQMLHNQEQPPRLVLDMKKPIDQAIADYLSNFIQYEGLSVEYRPSTDTPPVLGAVLSGTAYRPNLGPPPSKGGGGSSKQSVWDYLTDIVGSIGHNIRMDESTIIVQRTRSLLVATAGSSAARPDDPYKGRTVDGQSYPYRPFLFGRNIKEMKVARNYAKQQVQNVEVRSYVTERKTTLVARFPQPADRQYYALPGPATDQKWTVVKVSGITDFNTLRSIAQDYYEAQGRQELMVEIQTDNMASFGGDNMDPDVLDMKVGDTFQVLVNRDPDDTSTLTRMETLLTAQQTNAQLMVSLGFSQDFANAYAAAYVNANFLTLYKLKTLKVDWSVDDGVKMIVGGINYIEVRADKQLPPGQETSATQLQNTTPATNLVPATPSQQTSSTVAQQGASQGEQEV